MRPFDVDADPNNLGNGDLAIRTDKGRLVALVYARQSAEETTLYAQVIAEALRAAFAPGHTDLMVSPEELDVWLDKNPLPPTIHIRCELDTKDGIHVSTALNVVRVECEDDGSFTAVTDQWPNKEASEWGAREVREMRAKAKT